jgi:hypothetical protein
MKMWITALMLVMVGLPAEVSAQLPLVQGERLRVGHVDGFRVTGTLVSASAEEIRLVADRTGEEHVIMQSEIGSVARSLGRQHRFGKNFLVGFASTVLTGGVVSFLTYPHSRGAALREGLVGGAIGGVPIGLVTGLVVREERWLAVPLSPSGTQHGFDVPW